MISTGARAFWHFWDDYKLEGLRVCDVLGVPVLRYTDQWPERATALVNRPGFQERALATAYVAHFQFKSEAGFRPAGGPWRECRPAKLAETV